MPSSESALTRSLDDVAEQLHRAKHLYARAQCVDGSTIEGEILDVGEADLIVLDVVSGSETHLLAHQLATLDISSPRRIREWLMAICAIPVVTAILVAFSRIPWVDPNRGDITIGFMVVAAVVWALGRVSSLRKMLEGQLTRWVRVYPPRGA